MPASMSLEQKTSVTLTVHTNNPAAEVFLIDPQLQLVARGVGRLSTDQIPGVYKLRVRLGHNSEDRLLLLEHDTTLSIDAPGFASPAPLQTTTLTHEYHIAAAEAQSARSNHVLGSGSGIFCFVRYFTPPNTPPRTYAHPGRGLAICSVDHQVLVDLETGSVAGGSPDPWAACQIAVDPGPYLLRWQSPQGSIEQTVIASPDWQTQIFLLRSQAPANETTPAGEPADRGFDAGTVLMSRGTFSSGAADLRSTELARIALADERPILGAQLRELLVRKFDNPMQGIFGAHLMLLARDRAAAPKREQAVPAANVPVDPEEPFDQGLFDEVVGNLRRLVGTGHPDVEALSLECADPALGTKQVFAIPPMLRRSWSLIVAASNDEPGLLDERLWHQVMARTMTAPFLSWGVVSDDARAELQRSMEEVVEARERIRSRRRPMRGGPELLADELLPEPVSFALPSDDFRRKLSIDLEMPRIAVEKILRGS